MEESNTPKVIESLMTLLLAAHDGNPFSGIPMCAPTGSRVICTPPVLTTDNDWLVFVPDELQDIAINFLIDAGATYSEDQEKYPDGVCFHYGDVNPILLWDHKTFYRWVVATYWANKLNLTLKADRILFFQSLVDENAQIDQFILQGKA